VRAVWKAGAILLRVAYRSACVQRAADKQHRNI
jgi:hypothetical protein